MPMRISSKSLTTPASARETNWEGIPTPSLCLAGPKIKGEVDPQGSRAPWTRTSTEDPEQEINITVGRLLRALFRLPELFSDRQDLRPNFFISPSSVLVISPASPPTSRTWRRLKTCCRRNAMRMIRKHRGSVGTGQLDTGLRERGCRKLTSASSHMQQSLVTDQERCGLTFQLDSVHHQPREEGSKQIRGNLVYLTSILFTAKTLSDTSSKYRMQDILTRQRIK